MEMTNSKIINPFATFPPLRPRNAQMDVKIVFYKHIATGRITVGFPEQFPAPTGSEKIICNHASDVERWSSLMRQQDKEREEMTDIERELFEAPIRAEHRKELQHLAANARNQLNRDFCLFAIKKIDEADARGKTIRDSYMHVEAFEAGK